MIIQLKVSHTAQIYHSRPIIQILGEMFIFSSKEGHMVGIWEISETSFNTIIVQFHKVSCDFETIAGINKAQLASISRKLC